MKLSLLVSLIRVSFHFMELIVFKAIVVGVLNVAVTSVEADTLWVVGVINILVDVGS